MSQVIATETCIVHNDALGIDQKVFAGLPVPPDLVAAYKRLVGDAAAQQSPAEQVAELERDRQPGEEVSTGDDRDGDDLDAMAVDELAKLAADRGVEIVGTGHNGRVLKADLVDALSA